MPKRPDRHAELPPQPLWQRTWAVAAAFFLTALAVYWPALQGAFIWDDALFVNAASSTASGWQFWVTPAQPDYLPLTFSAFWLEWRAWGATAPGYHLVNVLLHVAVAVALWRLLGKLRVPGALVAAALFLVHPVAVESVAWIAEQKTLLSMLLAVLALLAYLDFEDSHHESRYWTALALFFLSAAAKAASVTLPIILLLCLWWRRRRITRADIVRALPFFAISAFFSATAIIFQRQVFAGRAMPLGSVGDRAAQAVKAIWFYLAQAVAPHRLMFFYPAWRHAGLDIATVAGAIALIVPVAISWRFRQSWGRAVLFALGCFGAALLPILGLVNHTWLEFAPVADHYLYFALIAPLALLCAAAAKLLRRTPPVVRIAAAMVVATMFCAMTWAHGRDFRDEETLWTATLARNPQAWMAENGLGMLAMNSGDYAAAEQLLKSAIAIKPNYAALHTNLGAALQRQNNLDGAAAEYEAALRLQPDVMETRYNLGRIRVAQQRLPEAEAQLTRAVALNPQFVAGEMKLAEVLQRQNKFAEAADHYARVIRLNPSDAAAHGNRAECLQHLGRSAEAAAEYRTAMMLQGKR